MNAPATACLPVNPRLSALIPRIRNLTLWAEGHTLHWTAAAGAMTETALEQLRRNKAAILAQLRLQTVATEACRGLTAYITPEQLLAKCAPEDIAELERADDPLPFLRSSATALVWTDFRKQGIAPPGWDAPAFCDGCGPVLLWASIHVSGCPWCANRLHGIKIPRPPSKSASQVAPQDAIPPRPISKHGVNSYE